MTKNVDFYYFSSIRLRFRTRTPLSRAAFLYCAFCNIPARAYTLRLALLYFSFSSRVCFFPIPGFATLSSFHPPKFPPSLLPRLFFPVLFLYTSFSLCFLSLYLLSLWPPAFRASFKSLYAARVPRASPFPRSSSRQFHPLVRLPPFVTTLLSLLITRRRVARVFVSSRRLFPLCNLHHSSLSCSVASHFYEIPLFALSLFFFPPLANRDRSPFRYISFRAPLSARYITICSLVSPTLLSRALPCSFLMSHDVNPRPPLLRVFS